MSRANENALHANKGAPNNVTCKLSDPDPLEHVVNATPADRLRWALLEQGHDPELFDLTDDDTRPATVVVRAPLRTATPGLGAVWWDKKAGEAVGRVEGTADELREAIAVLKMLNAAGPGDLPNAPPEEPLDLLTVIVATAHRLGIVARFRSQMMAKKKNNLSVIFATRDWLASDGAPQLGATDRAVLLALVTHMKQNGTEGRPRVDRLAQIVGRKPGTVRKALYRLRDTGVIEDTVKHPHKGTAQVWKLSSAFLAVLKVDSERSDVEDTSGAERRDVEDTSGAERRDENSPEVLRGGSRGVTPVAPKASESIESSSVAVSNENVHELATADVARQEAAGKIVVRTNRSRLIDKIAREDRNRLLDEDAARRANAGAGAAIEACAVCDFDGHRWFKADDAPTSRTDPEAAYNVQCDHTDTGDILGWATGTVMAVFPHAEVIEGTQ